MRSGRRRMAKKKRQGVVGNRLHGRGRPGKDPARFFPTCSAITGPGQQYESVGRGGCIEHPRRGISVPRTWVPAPKGPFKLTGPRPLTRILKGFSEGLATTAALVLTIIRKTCAAIPRFRDRPRTCWRRPSNWLEGRAVKELWDLEGTTSGYGVDLSNTPESQSGGPRVRGQTFSILVRGSSVTGRHGGGLHLRLPLPALSTTVISPLMGRRPARCLPYLDIPFRHAAADVLKTT